MTDALRRIFIAIPISDNLQQKVINWEGDLTKIPMRFLRGKDLHVTLVPPWYVNDTKDAEDTFKKEVAKHGRFTIAFDEISFGPNIYQPQLIWAKGRAPKDLTDLCNDLFRGFGKNNNRPFVLHLTLARFHPEDFSTFSIKKIGDKVAWVEEVNSIVMMESHLSKDGASYEIISKALLR